METKPRKPAGGRTFGALCRMMREERLQPVTILLVGINIVIFVLETLAGGSENTMVALDFGALTTDLVLAGEWWRLLTSMFLHFGSSHLASNMVTLFLFGNAVESLLGHGRMLALYLASGLAGNVLWLVLELRETEDTISAGASGAIFGLVGVYVAMALIPEMRRFVSVRNVIIMLLLNFAYGADNGGINVTAHAGGLIMGTLMGYIMLRRKLQAGRRNDR